MMMAVMTMMVIMMMKMAMMMIEPISRCAFHVFLLAVLCVGL